MATLTPSKLLLLVTAIAAILIQITQSSNPCNAACGAIPIRYPLGIDDGCGSPYYRNMLVCTDNSTVLRLRTPSGTYAVNRIDYTDAHLVVTDNSMWSCGHPGAADALAPPATPFALDTSTRFSLSAKNEFLFFGCDDRAVFVQPRPPSCDRFPGRCSSACDSAAYLCRNVPECPRALAERNLSCCSYFPKAGVSLRAMLRHCAAYAGVYWKSTAGGGSSEEVAEYGIRVDFEIPLTTRCLLCMDRRKGGGGDCGYDTATREFRCLCVDRNSTSSCADIHVFTKYKVSAGVVVGAVVSGCATAGIGALLWYIRKIKSAKPVTFGVQSNENRLF